MGKVDFFRVVFQDGKTTFFPGEVINGSVSVKVNSELKLRAIRLEFHGEANVFLSAGKQRTKRPVNSEVYIDLVATLFGKAPDQSGENPVLAPGEYSYPFQFHTPTQNLPTSVEGSYGHIRYWLKASIDRPWRFDITTKSVFTVIEYVDVNIDPQLLRPCQAEEQEQYGFACLSGPISVTVQTDRRGYCPGESVAVSAFINNQSSSHIDGVEILLLQTSIYTVKSGKQFKRVVEKVAKVKKDEIRGGGDHHMEMVPFPIPSLPPTMKSCSCIKISYELKLIVYVAGGFSKNLIVTIPITVGSVPYRPPSLIPPVEPSAPPLSPPPYSEDAQSYPVLPTYAECVYGGAAIRDENDAGDMMTDSTFTPMYPFVSDYQIPSTAIPGAAAAQGSQPSASKPPLP